MEKTAEKMKRYQARADADGYTLHTFVMDTFGSMDAASVKLLRFVHGLLKAKLEFDDDPIRFSDITAPFSESIARGNGECLWKAGKDIRRTLGINIEN